MLVLLFILSGWTHVLKAQVELTDAQKAHKSAGDVLLVSLPAIAFGSTFIWKDGQRGDIQFVKAMAANAAITYGLKVLINKERPNGENFGFPSGHTSATFCSAAFIQKRYGWKYGIPAYALAAYVGFSRIESKKHDGWDVAAGAILGTSMSYIFTKAYQSHQSISLVNGQVRGIPCWGLVYHF